MQAPNQGNDKTTDFDFDSVICNRVDQVIGFIDNKYSNGADIRFVDYLLKKTKECGRNISRWTYAGWNTNGNTVGTVVANTIILHTLLKHLTIKL